ncbi:MAG: hypothetical protein BGO98_28860 [Myxococcales bacterium 68-20]|nr:MAG: hypothetical protein BGO98_28860 [Myxococcales bacterium 68-20]
MCGLEAGVVEVYDALVAACRFGVPATTRCKLCAAESQGSLDRVPRGPLREVPANRCPACLHTLTAAAVDERSCPSCGARAALEETSAPTRFDAVADLERALDAWAERESFASREALVAATFVEPDITKLFAAVQRREPLEVLADPFANMGMRTTGGRAQEKRERRAADRSREGAATSETLRGRAPIPDAAAPTTPRTNEGAPPVTARGIGPAAGSATEVPAPSNAVTDDDRRPSSLAGALDPAYAPTAPLAPPLAASATPGVEARTAPLAPPLAPPARAGVPGIAPTPSLHPPPPRSAPPRAIVFPLVSVIAADGEIHPEERALVDRFLQGEGLAPLADHEFRVHHPSEVAHFVPIERREDVVKLMCETASIDGMPDESERRVIRAYATAWLVEDEKLDFWMWGYENMNMSLARQLFLKLRRFVLSARWSEAETGERRG